MVVGTLRIELRLHGVQNLKQKRSIVQKLLTRSRNQFPVSCAEVACQDLWQRAVLGFAVVSSSEKVVAPILERLESFLSDSGLAEIVDVVVEYIHI